MPTEVRLFLGGSSRAGGCSVGFVGGQQGCVYGLHAGGAGEGAHQPRVDAANVVDVKAGQKPNGVSILKIHHADHTPAQERFEDTVKTLMIFVSYMNMDMRHAFL